MIHWLVGTSSRIFAVALGKTFLPPSPPLPLYGLKSLKMPLLSFSTTYGLCCSIAAEDKLEVGAEEEEEEEVSGDSAEDNKTRKKDDGQDEEETGEERSARLEREIRAKRREIEEEKGETPKSSRASSPPRKKLRSTVKGPRPEDKEKEAGRPIISYVLLLCARTQLFCNLIKGKEEDASDGRDTPSPIPSSQVFGSPPSSPPKGSKRPLRRSIQDDDDGASPPLFDFEGVQKEADAEEAKKKKKNGNEK